MSILKNFGKKTAKLIKKNISKYKFSNHKQRASEIGKIAKKSLNLGKSYNLIKK